MPEGDYTVRETTAPKGYHKAADQTARVVDEPANEPLYMLVGKYDGENTYTGGSCRVRCRTSPRRWDKVRVGLESGIEM